jgi:hypothetical protein
MGCQHNSLTGCVDCNARHTERENVQLRADLAAANARAERAEADAEQAIASAEFLNEKHDKAWQRAELAEATLPECPRGHSDAVELPDDVAGSVEAALRCRACQASYVRVNGRWFETPEKLEVTRDD